jgi:thiamine biosynthesis lipoprotein
MPSARSSQKPGKAPKPYRTWGFEAIGTTWWIGLYQDVSETLLAQLQRSIADRIELFDSTYSRFRDDSLISRVSRAAGVYAFPPDAEALFALYRKLYELSGGLVTPLIGQVLADAGYDASYRLTPPKLSPPPDWDSVMHYSGGTLTTRLPVLLDFGAAGKGYLVDLISGILLEAGIERFCVDGSGDMYCHGLETPLRIGLEHPGDTAQAVGVAEIQNGALCGSAGNRRAWGNYHHIMNPRSLRPVRNIQAVWTYADSALQTDGLATALFFVPARQLQPHFSFAHCVIYDDNSLQRSTDFPAELFS